MAGGWAVTPERRPAALLLAAVLVIAGEAAIALALPVNAGRHFVDDLLARIDAGREWRPAVVLGDSSTMGALEGTPVAARVNDLSSSAAIGFAGQYFLYHRLADGLRPPALVVLSVIPESYESDLNKGLHRTYFESCFNRYAEMGDFLRTAGRRGQFLRMAMERTLAAPSFRARGSVGRLLAPYLRFFGDRESGRWLVPPDSYRRNVRADLLARASRGGFVFSPLQRAYLDRLASELDGTGARLVLMTGPLPRSVLEGWRRTGLLREYEAALRAFAAGHGNVVVEPPGRFAVFEDEQMYDWHHLTREAREAYGAMLSARIEGLLAESR